MASIESDMIKSRSRIDIQKQLQNIPEGSEYHANRYDTDTSHKLHIWDNKGNSYDIEVSKI